MLFFWQRLLFENGLRMTVEPCSRDNEFVCKNFSNFFFVSSKMKIHLTCLRPHIWSPCFFQGQDGLFFKVSQTSEESHLKLFRAIWWAENILRDFRTTWPFDHFVVTYENRALYRPYKEFDRKKISNFFKLNLNVKFLRIFFTMDLTSKNFSNFWGKKKMSLEPKLRFWDSTSKPIFEK